MSVAQNTSQQEHMVCCFLKWRALLYGDTSLQPLFLAKTRDLRHGLPSLMCCELVFSILHISHVPRPCISINVPQICSSAVSVLVQTLMRFSCVTLQAVSDQLACLRRHLIRSTALELLNLTSGGEASVEELVLCELVVQTTFTCRGQREKC